MSRLRRKVVGSAVAAALFALRMALLGVAVVVERAQRR